jgi:uncharacterized protein (DUF2252 family)
VPTRQERYRHGKSLRRTTPRSDQAAWKRRPDSIDPVALLEESNANRIPGLVPLRYARMAQSPFAFFRGAAIVQARDLASAPVSGVSVQLCGDCHLMNFGGFATAERNLIFDINDFDETYPGPWEWDVKRLVTSFVLAARIASFSEAFAKNAVLAGIASYRERVAEYAQMSPLEVWYTQIGFPDLQAFFRSQARIAGDLRFTETIARRRTSETLFPKLTSLENGQARIVDNPPLVYHFEEYAQEWSEAIRTFLDRYRKSMPEDRGKLFDRYRLQDIAVKVVGVGSVGTRCIVALFLADETDPLFLQAKEARRSVLEPPDGPSRYEHQGSRVVYGQRLMQAASDIFLGWAAAGPHEYYLRQLRDMKVSAQPETFRPSAFAAYARMCGWALARAHAKAGDAATIAGYLGAGDSFDRAMAKYAAAYANQVERDYAKFERAIRSGRIQAEVGEFSKADFAP